MTQVFPFEPSNVTPFQFQPTFDGNVYIATVVWSVSGQRFYLQVQDTEGNLIVLMPLIGSVDSIQIASMVWNAGIVTVATFVPHLLAVGQTVNLTLVGSSPSAYNGTFQTLVTDAQTFTFPLASDPGDASQIGNVSFDIDMMAGYFASTLVFRASTQTFEVSP